MHFHLLQSEDVRLLKQEMTTGYRNLEKVAMLRDECALRAWNKDDLRSSRYFPSHFIDANFILFMHCYNILPLLVFKYQMEIGLLFFLLHGCFPSSRDSNLEKLRLSPRRKTQIDRPLSAPGFCYRPAPPASTARPSTAHGFHSPSKHKARSIHNPSKKSKRAMIFPPQPLVAGKHIMARVLTIKCILAALVAIALLMFGRTCFEYTFCNVSFRTEKARLYEEHSRFDHNI
jgi:hypothetical protein